MLHSKHINSTFLLSSVNSNGVSGLLSAVSLCYKKGHSINETIKRMIILAFNELNYFKSHHEDE